jgi:nucleoside-diphosphate-sugar epimerase
MKKNILLTGCSGMIGQSLVAALLKNNNYNIIAICRNKKKLKFLETNSPNIKLIYLDLIKSKILKKKLKPYKIFAVIHMASTSISNTFRFEDHLRDNFAMTFNLLNSIKKKKISHFIYTNTAAIYNLGLNLKENSPKSVNPYGFSKYLISIVIKNFCQNYKIFYKDLRIFSVFGESENKNRLTAGAIYHALNNKNFSVNTPNQFRDYLYVVDVINAILKSIEVKKNFSVNICSGKKIGTHNLVKKIFRKLSSENFIKFNKSNNLSAKTLSKLTGNNNLAKKTIGWSPQYNVETSLNLIIKNIKINEKK